MIRNTVASTALLSLALALGACGGGGPDGAEPGVDPAATNEAATDTAPTESVAGDPAATEPTEVLATETDVMETGAEAVETEVDGMTAEAGDGWTAMQGDWQNSAGLVKDRWSDLTEEEILGTGGDREQLVGLVQEKYGIEREQAEQEVSDWAATL